jgi:ABC-type uncharacterized transport system ATPase subunit
VLVTHKLAEVMDVADRIIVLRHGSLCGAFARGDNGIWPENIETETLALMFGLEPAVLSESATVEAPRSSDPVEQDGLLRIEHLSVTTAWAPTHPRSRS